MTIHQRLLVSVYDPQETREAISGGARVIDCEDPAGALGDISPRRVIDISDAVLGYKQDLTLQISTNIGENQLLFKRDDVGRAVQRFPGEIAGKAAQAALGVAAAMGTDIHPVNLVKVGLDGMPSDIASETLSEVVLTLDRSNLFSRSQVIAVFFVQDLELWKNRRRNDAVVRDLLLAREYVVDPTGDLEIGARFGDNRAVLEALRAKLGNDRSIYDERGTPIPGVKLRTTELHQRKPLGFADTELDYIREVVDLSAGAGADGVMIDTRIHTKLARVCCLDLGVSSIQPDPDSQLPLKGILSLEALADVARYCHSRGMEFWASGSIQPFQAQPLWKLHDGIAPGLIDGMAVRGGASGPVRQAPGSIATSNPGVALQNIVNRASKRVYRDMVLPYAPPT